MSGSLINAILASSITQPEVGMGCTVLMYTDRQAATIVGVREVIREGKPVVVEVCVKEDISLRVDKRGMSDMQEYTYGPDPNAPMLMFTLRRNGRWVAVGEPTKHGLSLSIGVRQTYHDFSF